MGGLNFKEGIIHYYFFQKKISKYFSKRSYNSDKDELKVGYLINPDWIKFFKTTINYEKIKNYIIGLKISEKDLEYYEDNIKGYIEKNINQEEVKKISNTVKTNNFDITHKNIFSQKFLMNLMPEDVFKSFKIHDKTTKIKIKYIFKKQMLILVIEDNRIIKIIIPDVSYFSLNKNAVNLSWKFYERESYESKLDFLKEEDSESIMNYFIDKGIFAKPIINTSSNKRNKIAYTLINEDLYQKIKNEDKSNYYNYYSKSYEDKDLVIKQPKDINFELAKRPSFRGLENVGATCYMNATLQCLVSIKPITDYLLNANKYCEIYDNVALCPLTLQYCQVLFGLFCNKTNIGYYTPKLFKTFIGEMNPLFEGVQANDSKDLIIFLLEVMNSELSKLHNKKNNIKKEEEASLFNIDPSNQDKVLKEFLKNFKFSYPSIIGANLCGFQKNVFICQKCGAISNNFNIFNILIFGLEATAKFFNLNNNIPTMTFDQCFQFLSKPELFQDTYCQKCKITGNSMYKENLYMLPNYLIIILNRGRGNIFNCKVDIPIIFDSSNYEERDKNKKYELIGVVSHFGESGMGGHFIAFCKHSFDNKWRCYNDCTVTESQDDFLNKGIPYILFYKRMNIPKNNFGKKKNLSNVQKKENNTNIQKNPNPLYNIFNNNSNNNNPFNNNNNINDNQQQNMMINNQGFNQNMNMNLNNNFNNNINNNNFQGGFNNMNNIQGNFNQNNQGFVQNMNNNNNFQNNNMNIFNMGNMNNNNG